MNTMLFAGFLGALTAGIPIAIAMCIGSLVYIWLSGTSRRPRPSGG